MDSPVCGQNFASSGNLTSDCYYGEAGTWIHHSVSLQDILIVQLKVTCVVLVHNGTKLNGKKKEFLFNLVKENHRGTACVLPTVSPILFHSFMRVKTQKNLKIKGSHIKSTISLKLNMN